MAKAATTTSYSGRTVDLLLLKTVEKPVSDAVVSPDVSADPRAVTGIEKLVQRYAQIFLTNAGTVRNADGFGTSIVEDASAGRIHNEALLLDAARVADMKTARQIRAADSLLSTPDDEYLESSEVVGVSIDRASASMSISVRIESRSGESYTYVIPVGSGV